VIPPAPDRVVIVCVGNSLAGDDAVGCAVHAALAARPLPPGVKLRLLGLAGIALLDELAGETCLVVIDAVQWGAPPGTVHVLTWEQIPAASGAAVSLHGLGIRETIAIGRMLYPETMPQHIFLVGIEGICFDRLGQAMSPEVAGAVSQAAAQVLKLIAA
jgi:hydrogenase maturation protease